MKNSKIAIIDDEIDARRILKKYLERYFPNLNLIGEADGVKNGIKMINQSKPDIILLDIRMNDGTGFELLDGLNGYIPKIIFTTAYDEYAIKAFKYKAIDYLLKPIDPDSFKDAINHIIQINEEQNITKTENIISEFSQVKKLAIPTHEGVNYIEFDKITYLKADASYCSIFLQDKSCVLVSKPLKFFADKLENEESGFIRIHKSFLLNSIHICTLLKENGGSIKLKSGENLPIARNRKDDIFSYLKSNNF